MKIHPERAEWIVCNLIPEWIQTEDQPDQEYIPRDIWYFHSPFSWAKIQVDEPALKNREF